MLSHDARFTIVPDNELDRLINPIVTVNNRKCAVLACIPAIAQFTSLNTAVPICFRKLNMGFRSFTVKTNHERAGFDGVKNSLIVLRLGQECVILWKEYKIRQLMDSTWCTVAQISLLLVVRTPTGENSDVVLSYIC